MARIILIRCIYGVLGREITKCTVIYGVHLHHPNFQHKVLYYSRYLSMFHTFKCCRFTSSGPPPHQLEVYVNGSKLAGSARDGFRAAASSKDQSAALISQPHGLCADSCGHLYVAGWCHVWYLYSVTQSVDIQSMSLVSPRLVRVLSKHHELTSNR